MTLAEYKQLFDKILDGSYTPAPYDTPTFQNYVKLNRSRMKRWTKRAKIGQELENLLQKITTPQHWIIITEPWCGDAANLTPYFEKMAAINPLIEVTVQLRDSDSEIDQYLTNGGKSIPIAVARDQEGNDLFVWGPRPAPAQALVLSQKSSPAPKDEKYAVVLQWYKEDEGKTLQAEISALLTKALA
ncbi:MAG: thioredoxin family protein [Aureispira sp.]